MWLWILAILLIPVIFFVWGLMRLRKCVREVNNAIVKVQPSDIGPLADECQRVVFQKFAEHLSLSDLEGSARIISKRVADHSFRDAFHKDDFWWYYVLPVGAYLGELMRTHAKAEWRVSEEGGMEMSIPVEGGAATIFPFDKVLKQITSGDPGDLHAYINSAVGLDAVLESLPPQT